MAGAWLKEIGDPTRTLGTQKKQFGTTFPMTLPAPSYQVAPTQGERL